MKNGFKSGEAEREIQRNRDIEIYREKKRDPKKGQDLLICEQRVSKGVIHPYAGAIKGFKTFTKKLGALGQSFTKVL